MIKQQLILAIKECDQGLLVFNNGSHRSFLYQNKWYPLRATVNRARQINGEDELTTDRALLQLALTLDYISIDEVVFEGNFPIIISQSEKLSEIKKITSILNDLINE
jgi:hypothetical protein